LSWTWFSNLGRQEAKAYQNQKKKQSEQQEGAAKAWCEKGGEEGREVEKAKVYLTSTFFVYIFP
jgi:hypothetical protein